MIKLINQINYIKSKLIQVFITIALYFLMCLAYVDIVVPVYSFGGFTKKMDYEHIYSLILIIFAAVLMPIYVRNSKDIFMLLSFYFLLLPAAVLSSLQGSDPFVMTIIFLSVFSILIIYPLVNFLFSRFFGQIIFFDKKDSIVNFIFPFIFMISVLFALGFAVNFKFNFLFSEVYENRFNFNENLNFPMNYFLPFAAGPIMSYLTAYSFATKRWGLIFLSLICAIFFFAFSTHKAFLFIPFFTIFFYVLIRQKCNIFYVLSTSFVLGLTLTLIMDGPISELVSNAFVNRILFIPTQIHYVYFENFSELGHLYWAESKITLGLLASPLHLNSVNYIAEVMTGNANIGANVGWIANGYMNFGGVGIFIYAVLTATLLVIVDRIAINFNKGVVLASFSPPYFFLITSSDFLTLLLTGGVLPTLVILTLMVKFKTARKYSELKSYK